ncbi:hypothetical protein Egran_04503 [Elaphomyces granulatus]|uniref:Amidase domain-containing protein n=1 Tax=Elaphomyces granulatus TaxID=519963 RepID=A0A232LV75_9EURO|nr:hypothetical protein Egran_04503 [Elaphomyces granulatus]
MTGFILPNSKPYGFKFSRASTALLIIDMQRDFVDPNGFGSIQCGDPTIFSSVRRIVPVLQKVLETCRSLGLQVIHTREGHQPDLLDLPPAKKFRQINTPNGHHAMGIGEQGPMGRLLVRGEHGHDIIDELSPQPGEPVIDKPGKGSFWGTRFHRSLLARGITHLLVTGVTTECCVTTTLRECNDRGYECCILSDCTDGFDSQMVQTAMDTVCAQNGLFGYVGHSSDLLTHVLNVPSLSSPLTPPTRESALPSIKQLRELYQTGLEDPARIIHLVFDKVENYQAKNPGVWIFLKSRDDCVADANALAAQYSGKPLPPLFGVPFGVKDNIDVEGITTTAACDKFSYVAESHAPAVDLVLKAGGLFIGKLNLDQLATGLSGCRSPYGTPHCVYSKDHIPGGSSSGSAVAVAAGLISFALATDTAGSGRVPAAFNNIVGLKPTKGTISTRGVVPACKGFDTISIMAPTLPEARTVWLTIDHYDPVDPYAKIPTSLLTWHVDFRGPREGGFTFAIPPESILGMCSNPYRDLFSQSVQMLRSCGGSCVDIDYAPFQKASELLYGPAFLSCRVASIGHDFLLKNLTSLHPTTQTLFRAALEQKVEPWIIFQDQALQAECTMKAQATFNHLAGGIDVLLVPTAPCHPMIEEMDADPVALNSKLGVFTHAANVIDLCGVSVNAGWVEDSGLPFGVTFLGGRGYDAKILDIAAVFMEKIKARVVETAS